MTPAASLPRYELRLKVVKRGEYLLAIWQVPSPSTPRLKTPELVATIKGKSLRLMEPRLLKRLKGLGISLGRMAADREDAWPIDEEAALTFGLLFRTLAPMRSIDRIRAVADGIDEMSREEAGYWLGMAMHRKKPRRVLAALRMLLTTT